MKRIISLILALSLILSFSAFASEKDALISSGIIPSGTASENGGVTRGSFAEMIVALINMEELTVPYESVYSDIDGETDMGKAVITLTNMKIMSGYSDGTFRPERELMVSEAVKIIVQLLGYGYKANAYGGYPTGYVYMANELKLMNGVVGAYTDNISYESAVMLIYNSLDVPLSVASGVGENITYTVDKNVNILSLYHNMGKAEGMVTATVSAAIRGYFETGDEGKIRIGSELYNLSGISAMDYLGLTVDFIYRIDESSDEKTIVSIEPDSRNKIKEINMEDYEGINGNEFLYEENNKTAKQSFSVNADVIFNGSEGEISKAVLDGIKEGSIRFISTEKNSVYDLIIIKSYKDIIAGRIDDNNKKIYDELNASEFVSLDDTKKTVKIFDSEGKEISFRTISSGDVLTIAESEKYCEVYVTSQSVNGILESSYEDKGNTILQIGERSIILTSDAASRFRFTAGENIRITLNYFGKGVKLKTLSKDGFEFVYLVKVGGKSNSVDESVSVKIFSAEKGLLVSPVSVNLNLNGRLIKNVTAKNISDEMGGNTESMIGIKYSENGEITHIITPKPIRELEESNQDGFTRTHALANRRYGDDPPHFSRSFMVKKNTPVFQIPADIDEASDDDFIMTTPDSMESGDILVEAYNSTVDYTIPEFIVYRPASGAASVPAFKYESELVVVKEISKVLDDDGAPATRYTVQNGSSEDYFYYDNSDVYDEPVSGKRINITGLSKGDIIRFSSDSNKYVRMFDIFYDYSEDEAYNMPSFTTTGYLMTTIEKVLDSYVYVPYWWQGSDDLYGVVDLSEKTLGIGGISVIEARESGAPVVTGGSSADVLPGNRALIHLAYGQLIGIIILR